MTTPPTTDASRRRFPMQPLQKLLGTFRRLLSRPAVPVALEHRSQTDHEKCSGKQHPTAADKRRHPRINLTETTIQVTDGCLFATALIDNISLCGICLRNLPEQLYRSARQLTVYSTDNPGIPILHIQPEWETTGWDGKTIGASILNTSEPWNLFLVHTAGKREA
jgi:hypothetical protein